jgi:hypothetical protein
MTPEEIRFEALKIAHHPGAPVDEILSAAVKFEAFINGSVTVTMETKPSKKTRVKDPGPDTAAAEEAELGPVISYNEVKKQVLEVAKLKGREASLDLLEPFGVVKGEGKERTGTISLLAEDQYADVIANAKKMLTKE